MKIFFWLVVLSLQPIFAANEKKTVESFELDPHECPLLITGLSAYRYRPKTSTLGKVSIEVNREFWINDIVIIQRRDGKELILPSVIYGNGYRFRLATLNSVSEKYLFSNAVKFFEQNPIPEIVHEWLLPESLPAPQTKVTRVEFRRGGYHLQVGVADFGFENEIRLNDARLEFDARGPFIRFARFKGRYPAYFLNEKFAQNLTQLLFNLQYTHRNRDFIEVVDPRGIDISPKEDETQKVPSKY